MPLPPSPWLIFLDDEQTGLPSLLGTLLLGIQQQKQIIFVQKNSFSPLQAWCKKVGIKAYVLNQSLSDNVGTKSLVKRLLKYNQPASVIVTADGPGNNNKSTQAILNCLKVHAYSGNILVAYKQQKNARSCALIDISQQLVLKQKLLQEWQATNQKIGNSESISYYQLAIENVSEEKKHTRWFCSVENNGKPIISIVMRTRNRPELLEQAVAAVTKQDYPSIELVVVNDGGQTVADRLDIARQKLTNVKYISLVHNQGRAVAANTGLDYAQGEYIQFLDDDDLIDPDHLSKLYQVLQQHTKYQAAYAGIRLENQHYNFNYAFNPNILKAWNYIPIHAVLFSRELLHYGCRFDESLIAFEDWDFWIQVSQYTDFYHLPEFGGDYRQTGDSDGGTFQTTDKTNFYRLQVINKWKQRSAAEEMEDIYLSLKEYPSSNEELLNVQKTHLLAQEKELKKHIEELKKHSDSQKNTIDAFKKEVHKQQQAREDISKQLHAANADKAILINDNQRLNNSLNAVLNSRLWRMMEPLRKLGNLLKSIKRAFRKSSYTMELIPSAQLEKRSDDRWYSNATDPNFILKSSLNRMPVGWVLIQGVLEKQQREESILFFAVNNSGFIAHQMVYLDSMNGKLDTLTFLPENTTAIRIDPIYGAGEFKLSQVRFTELGKLQLLGYLLSYQLRQAFKKPSGAVNQLMGFFKAFKQARGRGVLDKLMAPYINDYPRWIAVNDTLTLDDKELIEQQIKTIKRTPKLSLIVDFQGNHQIRQLEATVQSLKQQLFHNWEIILLYPQNSGNQIYSWKEQNKGNFSGQLLAYDDSRYSNRYNLALDNLDGEFLSILSPGVQLSEHALFHIVFSINDNPDSVVIYTDDDCLDKIQQRIEPHFKPAWDPLLLKAENYIGHSFFANSRAIREIDGYSNQFSHHQQLDILLRLSEKYSEQQLKHIPQVLFHYPQDTFKQYYQAESYQEVLTDHFSRTGKAGARLDELGDNMWRIRYPLPEHQPLVSIIIPTRNGYRILKQCIESIVTKTSYSNYEIIVVDNQSDESRTLDYLNEIKNNYGVKIVSYDAPFNYSAINNYAVTQANGNILAFLNNDIEVISSNWLEEMVSLAIMPEHGVVGAMLYYPNDTIQHAGVIAGIGDVAGHAWIDKKRGSKDHRDKPFVSRYMTVSTAACIVLSRDVFEAVEGFNEEQLAVAYNDVDLCLKVHANGYHNVWTPFAELYHHESVSRGADDTAEKKQRYFNEVTYMWQQWQEVLLNDPAYNPNLSLRRGYHEPSLVSRYTKPWLIDYQKNTGIVK